MNKMFSVLMGLVLVAAFTNCGDNGAGSDETATIKIMTAADGAGTEVDLTALEPGAVETLYAVAFDDVSGDFVENVGLDVATLSSQVGTAALVEIGGFLGFGSNKTVVITVNSLTAPASLASVTKDGAIGLNWTASADTVSGYNVYRGTDSSSVTSMVGTATTVSYTDTTVTNGTKYFYKVAAMSSGDLVLVPSSSDYAQKTYAAEVVSEMTDAVDDAAEAQWIEVQVYVRAGTGYSMLDLSDATTHSLNGTDGAIPDVWLNNDFAFWGCENNGGNLTAAWQNTTKIYSFGAADFDDDAVSVAPALTDAGWGDSAPATAGHVLGMYTEDGHYAKVRIDEVNDEAGSTNDYVLITLGYQSIQGYANFKTAAK